LGPLELIPSTRFQSIVEKTLQEQMPMSNIWIISIYQDTDCLEESIKIVYSIVFLCVPKEITEKLQAGGVTNIKFYVGLSENEREYVILDNIPLSSHIATHDIEGNALPYYIDIAI